MKSSLAITLGQDDNLQKVSVFGVNHKELNTINNRCPLESTSNVNLFSYPKSNHLVLSCESPHSVGLSFGIFDDTIVAVTPVEGQDSTKIISNYAVTLDFGSLVDAENFFYQFAFVSRSIVFDSMSFCNNDHDVEKKVELHNIREGVSIRGGSNVLLTSSHDWKGSVTILSPCMRLLPPEMKKG